MMPISTPPNAIVFSSGHIHMRDMMKIGFWLNLVSILILSIAGITLIQRMVFTTKNIKE
jgi:sodium-dependent dicarboxylate transporter 2/3/5